MISITITAFDKRDFGIEGELEKICHRKNPTSKMKPIMSGAKTCAEVQALRIRQGNPRMYYS